MNPWSIHLFPRALALGALLTATALAGPTEPVDHLEHPHRSVRISSGRIHPEVLRIQSDDALVWMNYSPWAARISFDKSVAAKLKCNSRSAFGIIGDRLLSSRIQGSRFTATCKMSPGEYPYRVDLYSGASAAVSERSFEGRIVVE